MGLLRNLRDRFGPIVGIGVSPATQAARDADEAILAYQNALAGAKDAVIATRDQIKHINQTVQHSIEGHTSHQAQFQQLIENHDKRPEKIEEYTKGRITDGALTQHYEKCLVQDKQRAAVNGTQPELLAQQTTMAEAQHRLSQAARYSAQHQEIADMAKQHLTAAGIVEASLLFPSDVHHQANQTELSETAKEIHTSLDSSAFELDGISQDFDLDNLYQKAVAAAGTSSAHGENAIKGLRSSSLAFADLVNDTLDVADTARANIDHARDQERAGLILAHKVFAEATSQHQEWSHEASKVKQCAMKEFGHHLEDKGAEAAHLNASYSRQYATSAPGSPSGMVTR